MGWLSYEYADFAFKDSWKTISMAIALLLAAYIMLVWIAANVSNQVTIIFVFSTFLLLYAAAYGINIIKSKVQQLQPLPFGTVPLGREEKIVLIFILIALVLGFFLTAQKLTISPPLDVQYQQTVSGMDYLYKVIASPIIEELFRAVLLITTALIFWNFFKNWLLALLLGLVSSAIIFGIFHWLAYGQVLVFIFAAIVFGLIAAMFMILSKSIWPAIALHFVNNQLSVTKDPTAVYATIAITIALIIFSFWRKRK